MTTITPPTTRQWWHWLVLLLSFPLSGLISSLLLGRVDSILVALLSGAITGLLTGFAGALAFRANWKRWVPLTVVGAAVGSLGLLLPLPYGLLVQGTAIGIAQAFGRPRLHPVIWAALTAVAWSAAWLISELVIGEGKGWVVFGSSGALLYTVTMLVALVIAKRVKR